MDETIKNIRRTVFLHTIAILLIVLVLGIQAYKLSLVGQMLDSLIETQEEYISVLKERSELLQKSNETLRRIIELLDSQ